jgi:hypothetical protein
MSQAVVVSAASDQRGTPGLRENRTPFSGETPRHVINQGATMMAWAIATSKFSFVDLDQQKAGLDRVMCH